jgi:hypothetical protein
MRKITVFWGARDRRRNKDKVKGLIHALQNAEASSVVGPSASVFFPALSKANPALGWGCGRYGFRELVLRNAFDAALGKDYSLPTNALRARPYPTSFLPLLKLLNRPLTMSEMVSQMAYHSVSQARPRWCLRWRLIQLASQMTSHSAEPG